MLQPDNSPRPTELDGAPLKDPAPRAAAPPEIDPRLRAGAKLAAARQRLGLSLEQVSERLRISRDYLAALEAMNLKLIPGKAYARAFAKSYARLVGLDPEAIVAQFEDENALTREDIAPQIRNPASKPARERPWLAAAGIAVAIIGFIGWRAVMGDGRDQRLVEAQPSQIVELDARPPAIAAAAAPVVVEIRAVTAGWLEVRGPDGTIFISQIINPGQAYRPDVGGGWTIHARDGGAFEVVVAGEAPVPLGKAGAPVLGRAVDAIVAEVSAKAVAKADAAAEAIPEAPIAEALPSLAPPSAAPSASAPPAPRPTPPAADAEPQPAAPEAAAPSETPPPQDGEG